jgi:DNA-binding NarL/FixJ family response regulator
MKASDPRPQKTEASTRSALRRSAPRGVVEVFEELTSLPVSAAIIDVSGTIIAVNSAWRIFGRENGLRIPNHGIGLSYLKYCETGSTESDDISRQIRDLIVGRLDLLTLIYPCDSPTEKRWFVLLGVPLSVDRPTGIALLHVNLTELIPARMAARPIRTALARAAGEPSTISSNFVSGSVEKSVAETLSSELGALFARAQRGSPGAGGAAGQGVGQVLAPGRLSKRQLQVLRLLGEGKTNAQIAQQLFRSPNTVKLHVSAILQRLELRSRTEAALLASRLVWPPSEKIDVSKGFA